MRIGARTRSQSHVVVVPFFIADGLHSYQDIPGSARHRVRTNCGRKSARRFSAEIHIFWTAENFTMRALLARSL